MGGVLVSEDEIVVCEECGAELPWTQSCDELLMQVSQWEQTDFPTRGAEHHLLVICWQLQHPSRFSTESLAWARESLRRAMIDGASLEELRAEPEPAPPARSMPAPPPKYIRDGDVLRMQRRLGTLADVVTEGLEALPGSIRRWASVVLEQVGPQD